MECMQQHNEFKIYCNYIRAEEMKDYDKMKSELTMLIRGGNDNGYCLLGKYYEEIKKYKEMKKSYMDGITAGNITSMFYLAKYYEKIKSFCASESIYLEV